MERIIEVGIRGAIGALILGLVVFGIIAIFKLIKSFLDK